MHTIGHLRRGRLLPFLAAASLLAAGVAVVQSAAPAAAAQCEAVTFTAANSWGGGYQASVSITAGSEAVNGWTLEFTLPAGTSVANAWNTSITGSSGTVSAKDVGWNASIPAGQTREVFGAVMNGSSATLPTSFTLNGTACGGGTETPPVTDPPVTDPPVTDPPVTDPPVTDPPVTDPPVTPGTGDGFEDQTGTTPAGWTVGAENCTGTGTATIDSTQAHSGSKSVRIDGGGGYCNHVFVGKQLPAGTTWFRVWVKHLNAQPQNHTTFIAMNDSADGGRDLRIGGQNGVLMFNRESDDATLPAMSPVGTSTSKALPTGSWQCLEYSVDGGNISTYLNGSLISGLVVDGTPTPDIDQQWLAKAGWKPTLTDLRLGWESYGGDSDTLWYDDVAFGTSRQGC